MTLSVDEVLRQNTVGFSEAAPLGVPTSYSWYGGADQFTAAAPSGFTAVTAWGQVYQEAGAPAYSNPSARVQVGNTQTFVHIKATGEWVQVQSQAGNAIAGGHFATDFAGNTATAMPVSTGADGTATFDAPSAGYNDHFWPTARGIYAANAADAVYVQMDMRVTDPNLHVIANIGADWWRDASAGFVDGFANNPCAGMNNWAKLTTEWRTLAYCSSDAVLRADPPPVVTGAALEPTVTPLPLPDTIPTVTAPTDPTPPTPAQQDTAPAMTPPAAAADANLLVNGSFEQSAVAPGQGAAFDAVPGWQAISGGKIELWNQLNGVSATEGAKFGELDYLGAQDGLTQTVKTAAGQSYALSFDARNRPGLSASTCSIEVLWNDKLIATVPPGSDWSRYNFPVVGTGQDDRLTLREVASQGGDGLGALYDNVSLVATGPAAPAQSTAPATVGAGSDQLLLQISQDAYQGDAQYTVSVDGRQVGDTQTAHASHADGKADQLLVLGDWGAGGHTVSVNFLNDAWDGTPSTDRNLYVTGASHNGADVAGAAHSLYGAGPQSFTFGG
ncbi:carbohydrate-binding domain-containing protein [Methylobacterium sp. WSM2598]|uniref:carbohydrate-binding domain-containing protein n=1 Tax=Methylobacterium sp. WSM2598 TaxID=398261 RepID=UPI000363768F|nr:carbohydrate-binding domain-containing protein [Methylobacterium sp. WSM2598]